MPAAPKSIEDEFDDIFDGIQIVSEKGDAGSTADEDSDEDIDFDDIQIV